MDKLGGDMHRSPHLGRVLLVGLVAVAGSVLAFEIAAGIVLPQHVETLRRTAVGDDRIVFVTPRSYVDAGGYYKFAPNMRIEEVVYYPDRKGRVTEEYRCSYQSDELGFLSNAVSYEKAEILLLGDSFAQGQGGCAWLPQLSARNRDRIYSVAVQGHGFAHWERIVEDLTLLRTPRKVLIVFITHDFYRGPSQAGARQLDCLNGVTACTQHYWHPIGEAMRERAQMRLDQRRRPGLFSDPVTFTKFHLPATYGLVRQLTGTTRGAAELFGKSLRILDKFVRTFDVRLVWVLNRFESGSLNKPRRAVAQALDDRKLSRVVCRLSADGYLPRDNHPNAKGYTELRRCVERAIEGW